MPQQIYNEGRVVGMSTYELYLRHQLSEYPELEPLTEREWLASTVGNGCSMIMRVPKGTSGLFEKQLPTNSTLCAASSITGCMFDGQVELDATKVWATKVINYGTLISNTSSSHPTTPGESVNTVPLGTEWSKSDRAALKEYMKITEGLVYQPGQWEKHVSGKPYMDLTPDLHKRSVVRLRVSEPLGSDVYIVLSGWVHRPVVAGASNLDAGALDVVKPWNGDFLGAERFPWAVKIMFTVPTGLMHILNDKAYSRQLVSGSTTKSVTAKAIVDLDATDVQSFYSTSDTSTYSSDVTKSRISLDVKEMNVTGEGAAVIGAYQRKDITSQGLTGENYPPILYSTKVTSEGKQYMVPLDTGSPGTVKIFDNKAKAINYPKIIPNTYAFWHDKSSKNVYFVEGDSMISMNAKVETKNLGTADSPKFASVVTSGDDSVTAVSLVSSTGSALNTDGSSGKLNITEATSSDADKLLNWTQLLAALGTNKSIDLIGDMLRTFRRNLPNITSGAGGVLNIQGTGISTIRGGLDIKKDLLANDAGFSGKLSVTGTSTLSSGITLKKGASSHHIKSSDSGPISFDKPIRSGSNYIEFDQGTGKDPLRLYVSTTQPDSADVPVGSIGIGW